MSLTTSNKYTLKDSNFQQLVVGTVIGSSFSTFENSLSVYIFLKVIIVFVKIRYAFGICYSCWLITQSLAFFHVDKFCKFYL